MWTQLEYCPFVLLLLARPSLSWSWCDHEDTIKTNEHFAEMEKERKYNTRMAEIAGDNLKAQLAQSARTITLLETGQTDFRNIAKTFSSHSDHAQGVVNQLISFIREDRALIQRCPASDEMFEMYNEAGQVSFTFCE